jgi:hypothetical protein
MVAILIFNLLNFGIFCLYYTQFFFNNEFGKLYSFYDNLVLLEIIFYSLGLVGIGFFLLSAIFYLMSSCMDPGYVRSSLNMLELL